MLCLHGIGGNDASFQPQLESLAASRRVIAWNMPGYGRSTAMESLSFDFLAATLIQLLDDLEITTVDLMGQSIGGMVALETSLRYPERIRSQVLVATTSAFGGRDDSFKQKFLAARMAPLDQGRTMAELAPEFVPQIVAPQATDAVRKAAIASMAAVPESTYRQIIRCLITFDRRAQASEVQQPCCLIAGEHDDNAPPATMQRLAEKIPLAEYHLIANAGHLTNLEQPVAVNAVVDSFLKNL